MDQNFSLMAQSRANYYTAGSPVQFVRVELLKGDETGEIAVCLPRPEAVGWWLGEAEVEETAPQLVRVKRFLVKPMDVEDAIAQMEMLGHNFFLFLNIDTESACVVYKRQDGGYGLLEPENA